jgi:hypothetical protein
LLVKIHNGFDMLPALSSAFSYGCRVAKGAGTISGGQRADTGRDKEMSVTANFAVMRFDTRSCIDDQHEGPVKADYQTCGQRSNPSDVITALNSIRIMFP